MPHALIVDDDAVARSTLAELIARDGFTTAVAANLAEARESFEPRPDLVLVDLVLPDGSGIELLSEPRIAERSDIVLITGHASVETSVDAMRHGATDYLTKPLDLTKLSEILARLSTPDARRDASSARGLGTQSASQHDTLGTVAPLADGFYVSIGESVGEVERRLILQTVQRCRTQDEAARILGISTKTLYNKLRQYDAGPRGRRRFLEPGAAPSNKSDLN